jgi:hypothetical protein
MVDVRIFGFFVFPAFQLDCPDVAIFVDRMPVLLGFAFLKVHRLFANSAACFVGHGASWEEIVNA